MSDKDRNSVYILPLERLGELDGELLLFFLSFCSPRVREVISNKWLSIQV